MNGMNLIDIFAAISSAVTAVGVVLAWWQIRAAKQLNRTQFEDSLAQQYREIIQNIPIKALLGDEISAKELEETLKYFYHYIDLTNDQIFLRQQGRVSAETWDNWRDGIKSLMLMPAFSAAWKKIKDKPTTKFDELRCLEESNYEDDPYIWEKETQKVIPTSSQKSLPPQRTKLKDRKKD